MFGHSVESNEKAAMRVSTVSILINGLLVLVKLAAGILASSGAMVADAIHSASDVFSTLVVMLGIHMAAKQPDREHPYGHERMECIASFLLAVLLAVVGFEIGLGAAERIVTGSYRSAELPGVLALIAALLSIAVKEGMYRYTRRVADQIGSGALRADAWHHRSDALSSIGSFLGILFARLGFPVMDSVAGLIISLMILKAAWDIYKDSLDRLVDHRAAPETEAAIRQAVLAVNGVIRIDDLKTRLFGSHLYVDVEIAADGHLRLTEAHRIAEEVHTQVETLFPDVKHCMVHVNPAVD
ncbi:MAG: cation transporter [Clostridia bacterium]|nr:cation transporter [Clostridia bacterium]